MRNERTLKMMENFMTHLESGMSIKEIAQRYNLSETTVYACLDEIARRNGVSREELLQRVHSPHVMSVWSVKPVTKVDSTEFMAHVTVVRAGIEKIQRQIRSSIKECECYEAGRVSL